MSELQKPIARKIVLFNLDESKFALSLNEVERVVPIVEITQLPKAPDIVIGIVNFHEEIIPVVNIRKRFNMPIREVELDDQLIIARTTKRLVALVVDSVTGVHELNNSQQADIKELFKYTEYIKGIAKVDDGIVLINDLESFLSLDEQQLIDTALSKMKK